MDDTDEALDCLLLIVAMGLLMFMYYHGPQPRAADRGHDPRQPLIIAVVVVAVASAFVACLLVSAHQVRRP